MEEILDLYHMPFDPLRPMICMDEASKQMVIETRPGFPMRPGSPKRMDYEYRRCGTASIFMMYEPFAGRRHVRVRSRRTRKDFAKVVRELCDELYPEAEKIVLVMDNLNTHEIASLYEAFPPDEACRLARRLEIHYTPKHGSWLNMAEIELGVLARQCTNDYFETQELLAERIEPWERRRNEDKAGVNWRFTTDDARIKLKSLYPKIRD